MNSTRPAFYLCMIWFIIIGAFLVCSAILVYLLNIEPISSKKELQLSIERSCNTSQFIDYVLGVPADGNKVEKAQLIHKENKNLYAEFLHYERIARAEFTSDELSALGLPQSLSERYLYDHCPGLQGSRPAGQE